MKVFFSAGDSYTDTLGPWCPDDKNQYWYIIARELGYDVIINDSQQQRSNSRIIQSVVNHCLSNPHADTLYLINLTNVFRKDIVFSHSSTLHEILNKESILELEFEVLECELYSQLITLVGFLRNHQKRYYIVNNSRNYSDSPLPPRDEYVKQIKLIPEVLNWFSGSKYEFLEKNNIRPVDFDEYGFDGHLDSHGHKLYADYLLDLIKTDK